MTKKMFEIIMTRFDKVDTDIKNLFEFKGRVIGGMIVISAVVSMVTAIVIGNL